MPLKHQCSNNRKWLIQYFQMEKEHIILLLNAYNILLKSQLVQLSKTIHAFSSPSTSFSSHSPASDSGSS